MIVIMIFMMIMIRIMIVIMIMIIVIAIIMMMMMMMIIIIIIVIIINGLYKFVINEINWNELNNINHIKNDKSTDYIDNTGSDRQINYH